MSQCSLSASALPPATALEASILPPRLPTLYPVIIMHAIVDVRIATSDNSTITAMELLEEFADSTPAWSYLEDDTRYYSESRGCPACVLSHVHYHPFETVDFAFEIGRAHV